MILLKYLYIILLLIIFFLYGLVLSEIIDSFFPEYNENTNIYKIILEIIGEVGIAYIIYFLLEKYVENIIRFLYKRIDEKPPDILNKLLVIAFSFGIYRQLQKSTLKLNHYKDKYVFERINFYWNFFVKKNVL
jgi:hypothetical protein